ncbi:MAG: hypothetical protein IJQ79_00140 [Bacteroidales bacterium]|nr:hypothetical protein [Bacteroidales bacterium]
MSGGFSEMLRSLEAKERGKLDAKVPSWAGVEIEVPRAVNFQQCSSEGTARYKAGLLPCGGRVADLTGGLGVDGWAFSLRSSRVWFNERDAALLDAVRGNFGALGLENVEFHGFDISPEASDWKESLAAFGPDAVYLDPARRDAAGRKVFLLEECSPDAVALMPFLLTVSPLVMVKVSPMADITMLRRRLEPYLDEIHVIGSGGECKELLCLCRRGSITRRPGSPGDRAADSISEPGREDGVLIRLTEDGFVFVPEEGPSEFPGGNHPPVAPQGAFSLTGARGHGQPLFPVSASAQPDLTPETSASLHPSRCATLAGPSEFPGGNHPPVAPQGAFSLTGSRGHGRPRFPESDPAETAAETAAEGAMLLFVPSAAMTKSGLGPGICRMGYDEGLSHFGKFYEVLEELPFSSSAIKDLGRRYPKAEVTARGVPVSSEQLRARLKTAPGGPVHIFALGLSSLRLILVCRPFFPASRV